MRNLIILIGLLLVIGFIDFISSLIATILMIPVSFIIEYWPVFFFIGFISFLLFFVRTAMNDYTKK